MADLLSFQNQVYYHKQNALLWQSWDCLISPKPVSDCHGLSVPLHGRGIFLCRWYPNWLMTFLWSPVSLWPVLAWIPTPHPTPVSLSLFLGLSLSLNPCPQSWQNHLPSPGKAHTPCPYLHRYSLSSFSIGVHSKTGHWRLRLQCRKSLAPPVRY